jgi:hypothetical protein
MAWWLATAFFCISSMARSSSCCWLVHNEQFVHLLPSQNNTDWFLAWVLWLYSSCLYVCLSVCLSVYVSVCVCVCVCLSISTLTSFARIPHMFTVMVIVYIGLPANVTHSCLTPTCHLIAALFLEKLRITLRTASDLCLCHLFFTTEHTTTLRQASNNWHLYLSVSVLLPCSNCLDTFIHFSHSQPVFHIALLFHFMTWFSKMLWPIFLAVPACFLTQNTQQRWNKHPKNR